MKVSMDTRISKTNDEKDYIFFIPGLFKATEETKNEKVDPNDPFLTGEDIDLHCQSLFRPGCVGPHVGLDTVETLGSKFFERSMKLHGERQEKILAEEAAAVKAKEEEMKNEVVVKKQLDDEVKKMMNFKKRVILKRSCPVKIQYKSQLTHEEHDLYLSASIKFHSRPPRTMLEKQEYNNYMGLQSRVLEEQKSLLEFSQQVALKRLDEYNAVKPVIEDYVHRYLKVGYSRVLKYPRLYHTEQEIPIRPQDPHNVFSSLNFEHLGHLLSLGVVPWVKLPYLHMRVTLPSDPAFLTKYPPEAPNVDNASRYLVKTTVSEDPNCEYLAVQHGANVVITPSALKVLVDNPAPNFDKEFDIPVVIRSFPVKEKDGSTAQHRVVFVDKPIKRKLWTPLEKKSLFFKKSGLASMTSYRTGNIFRMKAPPVFHRGDGNLRKNRGYDPSFKQSYEPSVATGDVDESESPTRVSDAYVEDPFGPVSETDEVDIFSGNSRSGNQKIPVKHEKFDSKVFGTKRKREERQEIEPSPIKKCEGKASVIQANEAEKSTSPVGEKNTHEGASSTSKNFFKSRRVESKMDEDSWKERKTPWHNRLETDWTDHKKARTPSPGTCDNYHYHLFRLHSTAPAIPGLPAPAPLSIIVRNHLHGISMEHFNEVDKSFKSSSYVVFPKLENQLFFGCEVNSHSEMLHQWVQLLARPNTELLQVRVCSETGDVVLAEKRDLPEVLREGSQPHIKFHPGPLISSLYVTLDALRRKPPGQYLLHHHNRSEAFVHLLKEAKEDSLYTGHQSVFDLHRSYGYSSVEQKSGAATPPVTGESTPPDAQQFVMDSRQFVSPPWLPIDTLVPTAFHLAHRKIPATFPMANPNKRITNKRKRFINERAKNKKSLFDSPEKSVVKDE